MKYVKTFSNMNHRWDNLLQIFYTRYPNQHSKHVLSEDVISRSIENNCIRTVRLYSKTNETPSWLYKLLPGTTAYIIEISYLDLKDKTISTYSENLNLRTFLSVQESCLFAGDCHEKISVNRQAYIRSSIYGLATILESFGTDKYKANIERSNQSYESALQRNKQDKKRSLQAKQTSFTLPISSSL